VSDTTEKPPEPTGKVLFGPERIERDAQQRWAAITEEEGLLVWAGGGWDVPWCDAEFAADVLHVAWHAERARAERAEAIAAAERRLRKALDEHVDLQEYREAQAALVALGVEP
jgi:hypothetical protein